MHLTLKQLLIVLVLGLGLTFPSAGFGLGEYEFELEELTTGAVLDDNLLTDGKPLVIYVWAPDCPHCKRHMPYVAALYKKLDLKAVNFLTVSMGDDRQGTEEYLDEKQLVFPVMLESTGEIGEGFSRDGWPTTFIFAPGGGFTGICDTNGPAYITEVLDLVEEAGRQ